jgi:hypothetical protein
MSSGVRSRTASNEAAFGVNINSFGKGPDSSFTTGPLAGLT